MNGSLRKRISKLKLGVPQKELAAIERLLKREASRIRSYDSDSLYYLAHFCRHAAIAGLGPGYTEKCFKYFDLARKKASCISKDRITVDCAAFMDAVGPKRSIPRARKMLLHCAEESDIGIASYAARAMSMSYDSDNEYQKGIDVLKDTIASYRLVVESMESEVAWLTSSLSPEPLGGKQRRSPKKKRAPVDRRR